MIDLDILNEPQKEAVVHTDGPLLVLAGAGSGKTRVLTYRLAYILDAGLAGPKNILAMTFTNKAAGEMKERVAALLENTVDVNASAADLFWMGTFHSICVKILKRNGELVGLGKNFVIYDSTDQKAALKEAMKRLDISIKDFNPNSIKSYISSAKNEFVDPVRYSEFAQGYFQQMVSKIYPVYQQVLKENNAVDFDDLLIHTVNLLRENQSILEYYQNQFKYILVDEYQDTNHVQYILIRMLADKYKNICCVGDDDQSIYAFRGATIKNILNFEKDYPDANVVKLEQNYRSTQKILEASYSVISRNRNRKDKQLWTENDNGENIVVYKAFDEVGEGNWIVEKIIEAQNKGESLNNIAVLYRTNAQSRSLEESFINAGIPYKIVGGTQFYERKEIKDLMAYLKLIYNPKDNTSLERIINLPKRGIGEKTIQGLKNVSAEKSLSILEYLIEYQSEITSSSINSFTNLILKIGEQLDKKSFTDFIEYVLESSGYISMLKDGSLEGESRIENIKELVSVASRFESDNARESLEQFLGEVSLLENISQRNDESQDSVTLMTIHAAKGLEFDYVFIVGMEENLFPHTNSLMDESEMEEERRLAYVAITRAKKYLHLTHTKRRNYFGRVQSNPLSRFIEDINSDIVTRLVDEVIGYDIVEEVSTKSGSAPRVNMHLEVGDKVSHQYFGKGKVTFVDSEIVIVDFGSIHGKKELMLEYVSLQKI